MVPAAELAVAAAASASAAATAAELPRPVAVWWLMAVKVPTRHGREMNAVPRPGGDPVSPWTVRTMRPQPAGHNAAPLYPGAPNSAVRQAAEMQVLFHKPPRTPCTAGASLVPDGDRSGGADASGVPDAPQARSVILVTQTLKRRENAAQGYLLRSGLSGGGLLAPTFPISLR
jgi:hypothetical protein